MKIIYSKTTYKNAVYRASVSILIGLVLVIWPDVALKSLVMFIGALFLISGIMSFIISYRRQQAEGRTEGMFPLNGAGSILLGVLLISIPLFFTTILMFILGCVLLLAAIAQLATLSMARQLGSISPVNYVFPMLILMAGFIIIFRPWGSAAYVVVILGVTAIFYGITDLISQRTMNKLRKQYEEKEQREKRGEIEDADYEEVD